MSVKPDTTMFLKMLKEQNDKIIQLSEDKFKEVVAALELPTVDAYGNVIEKKD